MVTNFAIWSRRSTPKWICILLLQDFYFSIIKNIFQYQNFVWNFRTFWILITGNNDKNQLNFAKNSVSTFAINNLFSYFHLFGYLVCIFPMNIFHNIKKSTISLDHTKKNMFLSTHTLATAFLAEIIISHTTIFVCL